MPGRNRTAFHQRNVLPEFLDHVNYFLAIFRLDAALRVIPDFHRFANHDFARIRRNRTGQNIEECCFSGAVLPDDADAFAALEVVGKPVENRFVLEFLDQFVQFYNLGTHAFHVDLQFHLLFAASAFRFLLDYVKVILP